MDNRVFEQFRNLILRESGINLAVEKKTLLSNRIQKRLRELNLRDPQAYLRIIEVDASGDELVNLIDAISTNVTYFWREPDHFEMFADLLTHFEEEGRRELKIWCAASSSGEEPYTLAMMLESNRRFAESNSRVLATDICTKVLKKAIDGRYPAEAIRKLPPELSRRYFIRDRSNPESVFVSPELKERVLFKKLNLAKFPYPLKGSLDVIFCRNVMIYFNRELRQRIVEEFTRLLKPGGFLFLSHSENLLGITHTLKTHAVSVYRRGES